jgi:hypothetical protein
VSLIYFVPYIYRYFLHPLIFAIDLFKIFDFIWVFLISVFGVTLIGHNILLCYIFSNFETLCVQQ